MRKLVASALPLFLSGALMADVTVTRVVKSGGFRGMGGSRTESVEYIRGKEKRSDNVAKFDNALMNKMAGGERTEIVKIDEDKVYSVDHKRKIYRESSLSAAAEALKQVQSPEQEKEPSKPTHRITRSEFNVKPTGQKKAINGFNCEEYLVTMLVEAEDLQTKQKTTTRLDIDEWTAPETAELKALQKDEMAYGEAYMKKLGMDMSPSDMNQFGMTMAAAFMSVDEKDLKKKTESMQKEMAKIKGYPILMETSWVAEGENVPPADKAPAAKPAEQEDEGVDVSGGPAGILGGFAGKLAKKKMAASAAKREQSSGKNAVFSGSMEIVQVKSGTIPDDVFQIPAGYKKEAAK